MHLKARGILNTNLIRAKNQALIKKKWRILNLETPNTLDLNTKDLPALFI